MYFDREHFSNEQLLLFYRSLLFPRLTEEKMLLLLRQGKISKWFSGIGQEAIAVGATLAMDPDEFILPLHRNLGVFTTRKMPLSKLMQQWQGRKEGYSQGRERSFHFGSPDHHIIGMISHLGPQLGVADGVALAHRLRQENKATLVFTGEGATSEGDFHEALNVAAVWGLPVIFLIENNGYGLSTPTSEQYRCEKLSERARGYGMEGLTIDGNNILEVYQTIRQIRALMIAVPQPFLLECMTFRMRGHEEASGVKYVPLEVLQEWEGKDPVKNFENFLLKENLLDPWRIQEIREEIQGEIHSEITQGLVVHPFKVDTAQELADVYELETDPVREPPYAKRPSRNSGSGERELRLVDAIAEGLDQAMEQFSQLIFMGQDIAEYGGAFKVSSGLVERYGKQRVRNTPLCESAILGIALGLSLRGFKTIVEMQFGDFISAGFNQVVNNLAKVHYRWGGRADVVIRMPCGGGVGAGPFHSQTNEAWFIHTPGLKVVYPSTPYDAKGLLWSAIQDPNPILFFEHKGLYRSISGMVPQEIYAIEIGKARVVQQGSEISIITYGMGVHWAQEYSRNHPQISIHLLDLRSLSPLDYDAIREAVKNTGKVVLLHEDNLTGGIGGEIAAWIGEHCFQLLDGPVLRCASLDTPIPFARELEENFLASKRLDEVLTRLLAY
ncbi:MAG: alpha-ketoacid dehydrogenase subunit alpha/beta [Chitinophagaceae bacterium]